MTSVYGMSECMGVAPLCSHGHFHFMPWMVGILVDKDAKELPREGVQTGRLALFDLLAETYWGGFISGDSAAYTYLPRSVSRFFRPTELATLMTAVGYNSVDFKVWTFGTVAFHTAVRPPR